LPNGTSQLDPLVGGDFTHFGSLLGGPGVDVFQLFGANWSLTGSLDGGGGTNTLQRSLAANAAVQPPDALVWGGTAANAGWVAGPAAQFLATPTVTFNTLASDGTRLTLPFHNWQTGQQVVYRVLNGTALGTLNDNTVYLVSRIDANTIQLTDTQNVV